MASKILLWLLCVPLLLVGVLLVLVLPLYIEREVRSGISDEVVLGLDSEDFFNRSTRGETHFTVYVFDLLNARQVLQGEKPRLKQLGPFVYRQTQIRSDVHFFKVSGLGELVEYRQRVEMVFDKEMSMKISGGHIFDDLVEITTINLLFLAMRSVVGKVFWHFICDYLLWYDDFDRLFEKRSVHEIIQGYSVEIPELPFVRLRFPGLFPLKPIEEDEDYIHKTTVMTGQTNKRDVFRIVKWRDMEELRISCPYGTNPFDPDCQGAGSPCCAVTNKIVPPWKFEEKFKNEWDGNPNAIQGTNGERFRPFLKQGYSVKVFFDMAQRSLRMLSRKNEQVPDFKGIKNLIRFRPEPDFWANSTERPANSRFYQFGPSGLLNISILNEGAPLFISKAHFFECAKELLDGVEGLSPNKEEHDLFIDVEPNTGSTVREQLRAMVSTHIEPVDGVPFVDGGYFPNIRSTFVPIAWFNQSSSISQDGADDIAQIYDAKKLVKSSVILGSICFLLGSYLTLKVTSSKRESEGQEST